jgi:SAM-dependent methyltransferase
MLIDQAFNPSIIHPNYIIRKNLLTHVADLTPQLKGVMMDFGCGSKPYHSLFAVDKYVGVDYDNPGHPHTNEQIDVYYDGEHLPFEDQHFDSVFSSEVFEHIFNLEPIIAEINRVMKTGGKILFTCPFAFPEHEQPNDYARYTSFAIEHLLKKNGFQILQYQKSGNAVEAIFQLAITYFHLHVISKLKHIPVIRQIARVVCFGGMNIMCKVCSFILPKRKDLYLNNIVLAQKIA